MEKRTSSRTRSDHLAEQGEEELMELSDRPSGRLDFDDAAELGDADSDRDNGGPVRERSNVNNKGSKRRDSPATHSPSSREREKCQKIN